MYFKRKCSPLAHHDPEIWIILCLNGYLTHLSVVLLGRIICSLTYSVLSTKWSSNEGLLQKAKSLHFKFTTHCLIILGLDFICDHWVYKYLEWIINDLKELMASEMVIKVDLLSIYCFCNYWDKMASFQCSIIHSFKSQNVMSKFLMEVDIY